MRGLGRNLGTVNGQVTKQTFGCLTDFARGVSQGTVEACIAADPKGKIAKLTSKTVESFGKFCTPPPAGKLDDPFPEFGVTDASTLNAAGLRGGLDLVHDIFGANLDGGVLSTDRGAALCQQASWKAIAACQQTRLAAFDACEKQALAGTATAPAVSSKAGLRDVCLGGGAAAQPDPKAKIAKKCSDPASGIPGALSKKCGGEDLDALLPGCAGASDVGQCLEQKAACRACLAVSQAQDLDRDCDLFDDGFHDASCSLGPITILCQSPGDAEMLDLPPGSTLDFHGHAFHPVGIDTVTVNGTPVPVGADGSFSLPITTDFGINFVDIVATNAVGEQRAATCAFLAAGSFAAEDVILDNDVMLRLGQAAIDDNSRAGSINSVDDVLGAILNSAGLLNTLDAVLLAANPLKPSSCDQEVCVLGVCACVLRSGVTYQAVSIQGPRTVALTLVNGGLDSVVRFEDPRVELRVTGQAAGVPFDATGPVDIDFLEVEMVSDVGVDGAGRPNISVRPNSVSVQVGAISTGFSGLDGFVINTIVSLANGTIRNLVANTLSVFVQSNFTSALDGLVSGLDFPSGSVGVPRIGEPGSITLDFAGAFSSISANPARVLFGIGTSISASPAHAIPSLGVALPVGAVFVDPNAAGRPVAVATHIGVINQALHALWRGGLLHTTIDATVVAGVPSGTSAEVDALLPPVAVLRAGNTVGVGIGAVRVALTYPGVFDDPVTFEIGADATVSLALNGDTLEIAGLTIDALHLSDPDAALDGATLSVLETVGPLLLQRLIDSALGGAALAVRIPGFPIPSSLVPYGLPVGGALRLVDPTLVTIDPHLILRGNVGIQ
ncbi:MAG TPA: hypothetical protein VMS22_08775 [Candidatus Eisenbacteria bacterium]|nr:hypothetical protein [Candidatus Eisenbacteria bacterium]